MVVDMIQHPEVCPLAMRAAWHWAWHSVAETPVKMTLGMPPSLQALAVVTGSPQLSGDLKVAFTVVAAVIDNLQGFASLQPPPVQ